MFTAAGRQFTTVDIARLVILLGWTHVPAAAPDAHGNTVGGCTWMVNYIPEPMYCEETGDVDYYDDPTPLVRDCGAESAYSDDRFRCAAGHEHVSAETRDREGWDYAEDAYDAAVIAKGGRLPVPMGAGSTWTEADAGRVMAEIA